MSKKQFNGGDVIAFVMVTILVIGLLGLGFGASFGDSERVAQRQADLKIEARMCGDFAQRYVTAAETLDRLLECKGTYGDLISSQDIVRYQTRALSEQIARQSLCVNCDGTSGVMRVETNCDTCSGK